MNASNPWLPIIDTAVNDIIDDIGKVAPGDIVFLHHLTDPARMIAFRVHAVMSNNGTTWLTESDRSVLRAVGVGCPWAFDMAVRKGE
ncbi:hypothetical protein CS006_10535 [Bifidobacterium primatium]|uniref:Uncharacterized protein n=1 Tax=Bifidobacterium primatium TaxID=2045438 RepID=A0A2M9H6C0_9BIFI|nr:hypothetical protein [Bifidobacterium primatium]PJM72364.1 hypothetical protein CS006_10535 [Bifidobacterium primatium]